MLRPSMYQIIGKDQNYYSFVVAVAKRAREIADEAEKNGISLEEKAVKLSLDEFVKNSSAR